VDYDQGNLVLGCRNRLHADWLREKLEQEILSIASRYFSGLQGISFEILPGNPLEPAEEPAEGPRQTSFGELIDHPGRRFNPRFTFDHFVVGQCNHFAYAASKALAGGAQFPHQSIYLLSDTGLGKSHLSHAVANHLNSAKSGKRVHYVTAEQFANEMVYALRNDCIERFKNKYRTGCDVLLLESVEFLSGKEKIQKELVFTLDELQDRGKQVLCTGSLFPKDIPKLNNELRSRLAGILVAPINRPDFQTRLEIIRRKSCRENVDLPIEVTEYLADAITGDVRQLESCLMGVIAKSSILDVPVTVRLAQEVCQTLLDQIPRLNIPRIQQMVSSSFRISVEDLKSPSRRKDLALARKIAMYLCREYTTESLSVIGKAFGRSHSAVVHAVKGLKTEMEDGNDKLKRQVEFVSRRLETSCLRS
jgi:chromosomal replication initiator protein